MGALMNKASIKISSDWGHIGLLALFILGTLVFLYDTLSESFRLENVIVILPVSALVIVLCVVQGIRQVARAKSQRVDAHGSSLDQKKTEELAPEKSPKRWIDSVKIPAFMVLLGLYILGLVYIAFDLSTFLFLFFALWLQGEKHLLFGAIYAAFLAWALTLGLTYMVPFPFPTMFF
jgi:hypothetical protein